MGQDTPIHLLDEGALAECYQRYRYLVYKTALLLTNSAQDAEDVVQDVFLQVYRKRHTYDPTRAGLSTWLYRITVNICTSRRRRTAWRAWLRNRLGMEFVEAHSPSPEEQLGDTAVRLAIQQLSDKLRVVLVLRFYNELRYEQIAEILEIPLGTAKSRVNFALAELRKKLEAEVPTKRFIPSEEVLS